MRAIDEYRRDTSRGAVVRLRPRHASIPTTTFCRIGGGSLGGKARGLAFVNLLLAESRPRGALSGRPRSRCRRRWCWAPTSSTSSSRRTTCATSRSRPRTSRSSSAASSPAALPAAAERDLGASSRRSLSARGALVEPARGLAVPAVRRRLRDLHAAQRPRRTRRPAAAAADGDQARLRVDVLPRGQGLPGRAPVPPRGGEDGGDPPARRRRRRGSRFYPDFAGVARSHNFYPRRRCGRRTASPRSRSAWARPWWAAAPASGSARATRGTSSSSRRCRTCCATRSASSGPSSSGAAARRRLRRPASTSRPRSRTARWRRWARPTRRRTTRLRRHLARRRAARHLRADPQARPLPARRDPRRAAAHGGRGDGRAGRDRVRGEPAAGDAPEFGFLQLRPLGRVREVHELELPRVERERLICRASRARQRPHRRRARPGRGRRQPLRPPAEPRRRPRRRALNAELRRAAVRTC